jgi:hypothetical protein
VHVARMAGLKVIVSVSCGFNSISKRKEYLIPDNSMHMSLYNRQHVFVGHNNDGYALTQHLVNGHLIIDGDE